jgi:hypothetical protein
MGHLAVIVRQPSGLSSPSATGRERWRRYARRRAANAPAVHAAAASGRAERLIARAGRVVCQFARSAWCVSPVPTPVTGPAPAVLAA